jgi:acetyl-CoA carboxylase carboxyl transferase alpha subunit
LARHEERPTALDYISRITTSFIELHGDRRFSDDRSVVCGIADFSGEAVVIIGQERSHNEGQAFPEGFRKAQRAMRLAANFGLPVITLIDTPGAYPGLEAEERGMGQAIASTLALMSDLPTPIVSVIIGQGGSEGALALGLADRILMMENAIYSVISPENAASIVYRNREKAEEMASALKLTALDCRELGVVDTLVHEPEGGAHNDPDEAARLLRNAILRELLDIQQLPLNKLVKERYKKYRSMGEYTSHFRSAISKEVTQLQELLQRGVSRLRDRFTSLEGPETGEERSGSERD